MSDAPNPKAPLAVCLGLVLTGVLIAALGGLGSGSIVGGVVAAAGVVPAGYAAWQGMQQPTQSGLALAIGGLLTALGVGGLLIVLSVVGWLR